MDVIREALTNRTRRRIIIGIAVLALAGTVTFALSMLSPAIPTVARDAVWIDEVRTDILTREVWGNGTLVPDVARWVAKGGAVELEWMFRSPGSER